MSQQLRTVGFRRFAYTAQRLPLGLVFFVPPPEGGEERVGLPRGEKRGFHPYALGCGEFFEKVFDVSKVEAKRGFHSDT